MVPSSSSIFTSPSALSSLNSTLGCASPLKDGSGLGSAVSPDLRAVGDLLSSMKKTLVTLETTFTALGQETEQVAALAPSIKTSEQLIDLRCDLDAQIQKQQSDIENVKRLLEIKVKAAMEGEIRARMKKKILESIAVKERVKLQLSRGIPDHLRQQANQHKEQILEIKTHLHNSEARRYNSQLQSSSKDHLRPLLRPVSALDTPSESPLFPSNVADLFRMSEHDARQLVEEYGIEDAGRDDSNINKFISHIGLSYQLVDVRISASSSQRLVVR
ncbi:hypothetical protein C8J56DRAFT_927266 [Mycena floridula]|nr:hypothetical protein C8J56DRAFT_927266 [Mycena floridula]